MGEVDLRNKRRCQDHAAREAHDAVGVLPNSHGLATSHEVSELLCVRGASEELAQVRLCGTGDGYYVETLETMAGGGWWEKEEQSKSAREV